MKTNKINNSAPVKLTNLNSSLDVLISQSVISINLFKRVEFSPVEVKIIL